MKPLNLNHNPEAKIQNAIMEFLKEKGWYVKSTHGGAYQAGFPDLYATHSLFKGRWIEVKLPGMVGSHFTPAQIEVFPELCRNGTPVYIMTGATYEEYLKLMNPKGNYVDYVRICLHRGDRIK